MPSEGLKYRCAVFPCHNISPMDPNDSPVDPPSGDQYFNVAAIGNTYYRRFPNPHGLFDGPWFHAETGVRYDFFNISKDSIEQVAHSIVSIFTFLDFYDSSLGTELMITSLVTKIVSTARNMINNTHQSHKILFMTVIMDVDICYVDYGQDVDGSMEDKHHVLVPAASKSSIERLERVHVKGKEELDKCVICLQGLKVDTKVIQMPCSHLFHTSCIVSWLHHKNACPVCRFEMPRKL